MIQSYEALALLVTTLSGLVVAVREFQTTSPNMSLILTLPNDSESRLAMGAGIVLSDADFVDLQLVPGIGDEVADKILIGRQQILDRARSLPDDRRFESLNAIKGIGKKKAKAFDRYLQLE